MNGESNVAAMIENVTLAYHSLTPALEHVQIDINPTWFVESTYQTSVQMQANLVIQKNSNDLEQLFFNSLFEIQEPTFISRIFTVMSFIAVYITVSLQAPNQMDIMHVKQRINAQNSQMLALDLFKNS